MWLQTFIYRAALVAGDFGELQAPYSEAAWLTLEESKAYLASEQHEALARFFLA